MNGSLGALPSSVPSSLSSALKSAEAESCRVFSVGDEHAAVSTAANPAPMTVLRSMLAGSRPLPGLLGLTEACLRSEEHTSELQSLRHLVCRLLLEKKKASKCKLIYTCES